MLAMRGRRPAPIHIVRARFEDQTQSSDLGHRIDAMVNIPFGETWRRASRPISRNKPGLIDKYGPEVIEDVDYVDARQAHEIRLVSTTDSRLQWSVGAFSQDIEN